MKNLKFLIVAGILALSGAVANAATVNTLTVDFGGVYGGTLEAVEDGVVGSNINISTMTIEDDTGTTVYDVTDGILNFDTNATGFEVVITGGVAGLTGVPTGTTLFEGSFTSYTYDDYPTAEIFTGNGSGAVGAEVLSNVESIGDNPFVFTGFSLESANGNVLSTDFLMTATGTRTPEVPIPASVWLFGSGLLGLVGVSRRKPV